MTISGETSNPDLNKAQNLAYDDGFLPQDNSYVSQWDYDNDIVVRQLKQRIGKSNCQFKIDES